MIGGLLRKAMPTTFAERRTLRHDGELHLLEARRGRGKSYGLTSWARAAVLQRVPVVANFGLDRYRLAVQAYMAGAFPDLGSAMVWTAANVRIIDSWDGLVRTHHSLLLIDEVSRVFDSRHRTAPPVAFEYFQQSRKLGMTIVLASQSFDWLDVRIRQLADVLWLVRKEDEKRPKGSKAPAVPRAFYWYGLDPWAAGLSESVLRDRADFLVTLPFIRDVATLYNTHEVIRTLGGALSYETMGDLTQYFLDVGAIRNPFHAVEPGTVN